MVGMRVSMTMRSGSFWVEWIRKNGLLTAGVVGAVALAATGDGRYASRKNSSASKVPPTKRKYRAKGIVNPAPSAQPADHSGNRQRLE
jgi:hypothetical protein